MGSTSEHDALEGDQFVSMIDFQILHARVLHDTSMLYVTTNNYCSASFMKNSPTFFPLQKNELTQRELNHSLAPKSRCHCLNAASFKRLIRQNFVPILTTGDRTIVLEYQITAPYFFHDV